MVPMSGVPVHCKRHIAWKPMPLPRGIAFPSDVLRTAQTAKRASSHRRDQDTSLIFTIFPEHRSANP